MDLILRATGAAAALAVAGLLWACGAGGDDDDDEPTEFEGDAAGECSDAADNDQDGLFDCADPDCAGAPNCTGGGDDDAGDDDSATGDDDSAAGDDDSAAGDDDTEDDCITSWENTGGPFVLAWCTSCHSEHLAEGDRNDAPLDVNLNTQAQFIEHVDEIQETALTEDPEDREMPPSGLPDEEEVERVRNWIDCGCP